MKENLRLNDERIYVIDICDKDKIGKIDYNAFFIYDKKRKAKLGKSYRGIFINDSSKYGISYSVGIFSNKDLITTINSYLSNFFDYNRIFDVFVTNYLNPCLENTYDKISHHQVNHYEANVFIDCITTAINRFILKYPKTSDICNSAYRYLVNKKFKKINITTHCNNDDSVKTINVFSDDIDKYIEYPGFTLDQLFDNKGFDNELLSLTVFDTNQYLLDKKSDYCVYILKLFEVIYNSLVHYLFRNTCDYLATEENIYGTMIIADVNQYYNSVSNVFYDVLNKLKKAAKVDISVTFDDSTIPEFGGISDKPFKKGIKDDKDLENSINEYLSNKYSKLYTIFSLTQTLTRHSQNQLANVDSPAIELENSIYKPMLILLIKIYKKFYYSFYEKYIVNGFKDENLFTDIQKAVIKYTQMLRKRYSFDSESTIYIDNPTNELVKEYENNQQTFYNNSLRITDNEFEKIINSTIFTLKNKYSEKYGSNFEDLKEDVCETLKEIFAKIDAVIRYELIFKGKVNNWAEYLVKKAEDHIKFDVIEDCRNLVSERYSALNERVIKDLFDFVQLGPNSYIPE